MNYYEHHLGDYAKDTAHLSMLEHGAYRLLLDRYYGAETGIPADQAHRLARARSREEKQAVDAVLNEFFLLVDGVWINNRAEEEIAKFVGKKPKAEEKRENDKERQRKARERRKALFEELSRLGVNMAWNATTEEIHDALNRAKSQTSHAPITQPVTRDNTATQSPDPSHHTPVPSSVTESSTDGGAATAENATRKGELCKKLRSLGINAAPHLLAWSELLSGYSDEEIIAVAETAREKKPGESVHLNYLIPILKDRAAPRPTEAKGPPWWSTQELTIAKGKSLGLTARVGESMAEFKGRINEAIARPVAA
jgi:uncharacterized protein YdaU (DUF1376 family)